MPDKPHVFLSATRADLVEHREAVKSAILTARMHPVTREHFSAEENPPLDVCLREVEHCQALVCAFRINYAPGDLINYVGFRCART